jgi:hypothetical protein
MTPAAIIAHLRRWARQSWPRSAEPHPFERGHHCARTELLRELDRIEASTQEEQ